MKISGFTLVKNGCQFDYPFLESLRSMLPLVDELVINVGQSGDQTLERIHSFKKNEGQGKVRILERNWDPSDPPQKRGGLVLSEQTNEALQNCSNDWCLYLQADEVLHQDDSIHIRSAIQRYRDRPDIEGLLFRYLHFYGSYDVTQTSRTAYRYEVRMVRKSSGAKSVGDAQSFRKEDGTKLRVAFTKGRVFHYGWVRTPEAMREKTFYMDQLYHGEPTPENKATRTPHTGKNYLYKRIPGLAQFKGTHPRVMENRIQQKGWHWNIQDSKRIFTYKDIPKLALDGIEKLTGYRLFEYRSYRLVK